MTRTEDLPTDLPPGLAERLQRLAETQTAGSLPWPGVDRSLRRAQRRRLTGVSAVAVATALITAAAFGGLFDGALRSDSSSPARNLQLNGLSQLRELGYATPTSGSLAGDQAWLKRLRDRVQDLADAQDAEQHHPRSLGSADDVLVPWASELNGSRYALVLYPSAQPPETGQGLEGFFTVALLGGPGGSDADRLTVRHSEMISAGATSGRIAMPRAMSSLGMDAGARFPTVLLVTGPRMSRVEVATTRTFTTDGKFRTQWRDLPRANSMVWVGTLSPAESYLSDVRISGPNGYTSTPVGKSEPLGDQAAAMAPAGTNVGAVGCAAGGVMSLGPSIAEQPVIAGSTRLTETLVLGSTVLRSPNGVYLAGVCVGRTEPGGYEILESVSEATIGSGPTDAAAFMAAVERNPWPGGVGPAYVVIAPVGATSVAIGTEVVPVHDRLAGFPPRASRSGTVTVRGLDAQGKVIATVQSKAGK